MNNGEIKSSQARFGSSNHSFGKRGVNAVSYKHGDTGTKLYDIWAHMRYRCFNTGSKAWKWYGGRGIIVCDEWREFTAFKEWSLANGYQEGLSIDRIDNNGNYAPYNCQWLSRLENARKRATKS